MPTNTVLSAASQHRQLPPIERSKRRFKTGRNIQINIKGEQETKDELYRVADIIDEPLGETLKRALAALKRELESGQGM
ncbi:hypothetical protein JNO12_24535 [Erwinia aphidicola]|nr:hypothetical protein [Erwinia aphidicola]